MITHFASPERSNNEQISCAHTAIANEQLLVEALNAYPEIVIILDANRQIVFCNTKLLETFGLNCMADVLGKRPGEAFGCIHADDEAAGCGTSAFCRECGAVAAILSAQKSVNAVKECRLKITTERGEQALDLRVWAVPATIHHERFTVFTIVDIGDEKRREALERTFFHDILNEVALIAGFSENAKDGLVEVNQSLMEQIYNFSKKIVTTIQAHRDLVAAEKGELIVSRDDIAVKEMLEELVQFFDKSPFAKHKNILLETSDEARIITDKVLFRRILVNLIKNSLEAVEEGQTVRITYNKTDDRHLFSVNNSCSMPENIQHQIFQRSFSTKGKGRGIGTYSVKLFTENYLKGTVWFTSSVDEGTTFFVSLPA